MDNQEFTEAEFTDVQEEVNINGKPLYFLTSQVGLRINESDSTIRFWCTKFKDILKIEMTGSHRRFKEEDIEKLKFIKKLLREDNFSIQQVQEYTSLKDISTIENKIQKQEPLAMQVLARSIAIEIGADLEDFKIMIRDQLIDEMKNNQQEMKTYLATEIDNKLDSKLSDLKSYIDTKEQEAKIRDIEMIDTLKENMNKRKEETTKDKKGIFGKIFGK